jgi:hypothetical protein
MASGGRRLSKNSGCAQTGRPAQAFKQHPVAFPQRAAIQPQQLPPWIAALKLRLQSAYGISSGDLAVVQFFAAVIFRPLISQVSGQERGH